VFLLVSINSRIPTVKNAIDTENKSLSMLHLKDIK